METACRNDDQTLLCYGSDHGLIYITFIVGVSKTSHLLYLVISEASSLRPVIPNWVQRRSSFLGVNHEKGRIC